MLFNDIKRNDILYRSKNLLSEIWKSLIISSLKDEKMDIVIMRQIINSNITKIAFGNLFISPIKKIFENKSVILDVGCGAMTWFYDILCEYNQHSVEINFLLIGIDIINFFDKINNNSNDLIKDLNQIFYEPYVILDIYDFNLNGLKYQKETIDFIYQRDMLSVYKLDQWEVIINQMYNVLKSNAYLELVEYDINIKSDAQFRKDRISNIFNKSFIKIYRNNNNEINIDNIYKKTINIFGTKNVKKLKRKIPLYDEEMFNKIVIENVKIVYQYFKQPFMEILKLENLEFLKSEGIINESGIFIDFDKVIEKIIKEWEENKCYLELYCIYAQKK